MTLISLKKNSFFNFFFNNSVNNPHFLIFFRIVVGTLTGLHFISILKDFSNLYGMDSLVPSDIHTVYLNDKIIFFNEIISAFDMITNSTDISIVAYKFLYILLCLFIILGFFSRISAFFLLILQVGLVKSGYYFSYGVDFFTSMSLMYIILFPSDDYCSVKNLFWERKIKADLTPFRRTFQIHLCIAYFVSGFEKLSGYNWRNGESVWKAIHLPNFSNDFNLNLDFLGEYPVLLLLFGWFTIIVELFYPLFINLSKTRYIWLGLTVLLHLGIALCLNLYFFSALMITWNLCNYYFPDKLKTEKI